VQFDVDSASNKICVHSQGSLLGEGALKNSIRCAWRNVKQLGAAVDDEAGHGKRPAPKNDNNHFALGQSSSLGFPSTTTLGEKGVGIFM
jgi:hypothetical protein